MSSISPALIVDALLVLIALFAVRSGWRQGAVASVLSAVGIIAGLIIGLAVAPLLMGLTTSVVLRFLIGLAVVVLLIGMGNLIGAVLGANLRDRMRQRQSQTFDSFLGAVFQLVTVMVVCWLVAVPLATGLGNQASDGIRGSTILRGIDRVTPDALNTVPSRISAMLDESGLPPLVSPFESTNARDVPAPSATVADRELVEQIRPSIIHVMGSAEECSRRLMGSGFVTADDYVVTNAHVVAGTNSVRLDTVLGVKEAEVVYFNPAVDVAVLHSPGLGIEPLAWAEEPAEAGADAIVFGYPQSGPFEAAPARVADRITISGSDIYAQGQVEREAYTARGTIREGNSGGPLVSTEGRVLGVVFGASRDSSDIGFALTAREVLGHIGDVRDLTTPVDTQRCV